MHILIALMLNFVPMRHFWNNSFGCYGDLMSNHGKLLEGGACCLVVCTPLTVLCKKT